MELYNVITEESVLHEVNRICGCTNNVYSLKAKIARVNAALDKYWFLASEAAPKGSFDDVNHASTPIETQSLVDGTNAYKVSSFTNEVLQILKVAILDADADEIDLAREEFDNIGEFNELYSTDSADRGTPDFWTKIGDYIYLRPCPDYDEADGLRAYVNRELSKFLWTVFTVTIANPGVFSATAHGLSKGDPVIFETDSAMPTGLAAGTVYYVITAGFTADAFQVSTENSLTGTAVVTSGAQTGKHKFTKLNKEPGIPVIHHDYLARYASLPFLIERKLPQMGGIAQQIAINERDIQEYWQNRGCELKTIINTKKRIFR